jgi:hypothetical protein
MMATNTIVDYFLVLNLTVKKKYEGAPESKLAWWPSFYEYK